MSFIEIECKKYTNFLACLVRWCGARHFTVNLTHVHKFYQDELDAQQPYQVYITNVFNFLLF